MSADLELPEPARRVLQLARRDREAARRQVGAMPVEDQVALVCATPVGRRPELLDLVPSPERLVPALPEAELCFTVKAIGLADAGWILAHASDDQLRTCVDLDVWPAEVPDAARLGEWLGALAEGDEEALVRVVHALDPELLMLWLHELAAVVSKPGGNDEGWQPPDGACTIDGVFFLVPRGADEALTPALHALDLLFQRDYWLYFRLLQSVVWESVADNEEFALRWRTGRLADLGFPSREEAIAVYAPPRREELDTLPEAAAAPAPEWHLPVWMPDLPSATEAGPSLLRAAAELDPAARRPLFFAFVGLANRVAVADRLPLGDADSLPRAIGKVTRLASLGLDWMAERHGLTPAEVLRRVPLERLFRAGVRLAPEAAGPGARLDPEEGAS
jgi:hypothetical protein